MKIEELHYEIQENKVDESTWEINKWREEHPMDYFFAASLLYQAEVPEVATEVFKTIYRITRLQVPDVVYKYYSLSNDDDLNRKKLETVTDKKVFMSPIKDFNDPFDGKAFYYNPNYLKHIEVLNKVDGKLIDDFSAFIRGTSFTSVGINSMPMWAHYSNNHKGFCVSYDVKSNIALSSCLFPIQYTDNRLDITSLIEKLAVDITDKIDKNRSTGEKTVFINDIRFFYIALLMYNVKHLSWNYEKELRCTVDAESDDSKYIQAEPKEIFIGTNCEKDNSKKLIDIADYLGVPVYQMSFNENSDKYELEQKRVYKD